MKKRWMAVSRDTAGNLLSTHQTYWLHWSAAFDVSHANSLRNALGAVDSRFRGARYHVERIPR